MGAGKVAVLPVLQVNTAGFSNSHVYPHISKMLNRQTVETKVTLVTMGHSPIMFYFCEGGNAGPIINRPVLTLRCFDEIALDFLCFLFLCIS